MRASAVTPRRLEWLLHPFVPLGKLTALAGQMGQAKSLMTCWAAAAVTRGQLDLPHPASAVVLNAEDDPEDTIRPRLEAAGADLDRVWVEPGVTLDVARLAHVCDHEMPDVRLITVDPVQAYLPGHVNSWKGQDVRAALEPLRTFASDRGIAFLLVQHLNRRADAGDALARISDSQGIPQLARSVLIWGPDPADPDGDLGARKALTRAKGNLARGTASASFTIEERRVTGGISAPVLVRGADAQVTADDVVADPETRTVVEEAAEWLRDLLRDGPVPAQDVIARAQENGISRATLTRAKKRVSVQSRASRDDGSAFSSWVWSLKDPPCKPLEHLDHLEHLEHLPDAPGAQGAQGAQALNGRGTLRHWEDFER
jgi:putative DNA primase/helicase